MKSSDIKSFLFQKDAFDEIGAYHFGKNWPVVYLLENGEEIYIGESTNVYNRSKQHFDNPERVKLKNIHIITDSEYNKSATLDIESMLIEHVIADEKFVVQNGNGGLSGHNYFDREKYKAKFEVLWDDLIKKQLAQKSLLEIRNSQIFKLSPYKVLTEDQIEIVDKVKSILKSEVARSIIINGGPGTGKTVLATFMVKNLLEDDILKNKKIGLVVPMTSLRNTLKSVFSHVKGLKSSMVIGPNDVVKEKYDVLIVDESHRLRQRRNITNYASYDNVNKKLDLDNSGTELDWVLRSSLHQIFLYDKNQSVRPADIDESRIAKLDAIRLELKKQIRVKGGDKYIEYISNLLDLMPSECNFEQYDFKIFDDIKDMVSQIKEKDKEYGLSRIVAGYAWPWKTKDGGEYDIEIDGLKMIWNSTISDWVNSANSINEVGCIHTIQGYDLNYTGVIIGPEISYDPIKNELVIDQEKYKDINGKKSITDPKELLRYIINIYKTLLTRGIYGTYVYIVDENLRKYFKDSSNDLNYT
ncbi:MAG: hypothetical protein RIT04_43 [Candidatus Parcubacteria bacterium]|jgi:DUF2075 family protein/DNA replication protein DnaC